MAVYKRTYRPYAGLLTPLWARFLVVSRYASEDLASSRLVNIYRLLCFLPVLIQGVIIYVVHNATVRQLVGANASNLVPVDNTFFLRFLNIQTFFAFLLIAWIGPTLVAPDLSHNALSLYLSRPLTRPEYVLGKFKVLFVLLSQLTWIPGLLLFFLQASLEGGDWYRTHANLGWGMVLGSFLWIAVMSLLALAISAWIKWRIAASALLFGVFFVGTGFGVAINEVLRTYWGKLLNVQYLLQSVWRDLLGVPSIRRFRGQPPPDYRITDLPIAACWIGLVTLCLICFFLLDRRLRAKEVVNG